MAATKIYDAQLDEATIIRRTGHRSVDHVRTYKQTTNRLQELSPADPILEATETKDEIVCSRYFKVEEIQNIVQPPCSTIKLPNIDFKNATNCTINFK